MTTCPKCGFQNKKPQATDCPKCGLIYAKYQKTKQDEAEHLSAEWSLSSSLRSAMDSVDEPTEFIDLEENRDSRSYPMIENLSFIFICIAAVAAFFAFIDVKYTWRLLAELNASFKIFSNLDLWVIILSVAFLGTIQIAILLAIGGLLRIGKDIADNTRATRNYLAHIAQKTK